MSVTFFFMFANTGLCVTSQHHDVTMALIAILCNALWSNVGFLKTGRVEYLGVLQTPISKSFYTI